MTRRKNNKIARRKAAKANVPQEQTPEVIMGGLNSRDARRKLRRFGFQAHVVFPSKPAVNEAGEPIEGQMIPEQKRVLKLDRLIITTASGAKQAAKQEKENLLGNVDQLADAVSVVMEAIPHETISEEIYRLIQGYQDIERIAVRALNNAAARIIELEPVIGLTDGEELPTVADRANQRAEQIYRDAANQLRQEIKAAKLAADEAEYAAQGNQGLPGDQANDQGTGDIAPDQQTASDEANPRKLGIDAYNEIMDNPPEAVEEDGPVGR